jgi:hypothetical protein
MYRIVFGVLLVLSSTGCYYNNESADIYYTGNIVVRLDAEKFPVTVYVRDAVSEYVISEKTTSNRNVTMYNLNPGNYLIETSYTSRREAVQVRAGQDVYVDFYD